MSFVLASSFLMLTAPVFGWPLGQRTINRREARLQRLDERVEMRWQRLQHTPAATSSTNQLSPGMARRLRRQGLSPDEIAAFSSGTLPSPSTRTGGNYVGGDVISRPVAKLPPHLFRAEPSEALALPTGPREPTNRDDNQVVQSSANTPETVLVQPSPHHESATAGPQFPGLMKGNSQAHEFENPEPVVTHEAIQLLPQPSLK